MPPPKEDGNCSDRRAHLPEQGEDGRPRRVPERRTSRIDWATLLRRTFGLDVLACCKCRGRMKAIACISEPALFRKILAAMKLSSEIPRAAPARPPPQGEFEFAQ